MIPLIFTQLGSTNSIKEKDVMLRQHIGNELLKQVLYLALSPRIKFYIKKIPAYIPTGESDLVSALVKLEVLYKREKTGNAAIEHLSMILSSLTEQDAIIIERIIGKDLKIGVHTSTVNKVWPKLVEETPYMGAVSYNAKKVKQLFNDPKGVVSQTKMDGRYGNTSISDGMVVTESRGGEITHLSGTFDDVLLRSGFTDIVLNHELIMDNIPRYVSNGIIASLVDISKKEANGDDMTKEKAKFLEKHGMLFDEAISKVVMVCWDVITVDEYNDAKSDREYDERFQQLTDIIKAINSPRVRLVESVRVYSVAEALADFKDKLAKGEEGTILKGLSTKWKDGKPVTQVKFKLEITVELQVVEFLHGTKGTKNEHVISSVKVKSSDGLLVTNLAGISETMMQYITDNQILLMDNIVEGKCSGVSSNSKGEYALLHPVLKGFRDDKSKANSLKEILEIEHAAKTVPV